MSSGARSGLCRDLDNFLYSAVSDATDQTPITVLSALARNDVDPWHEAAQLAQMPKKIAIARLASMISLVNADSTPQSQVELVAARLVELLPTPSVLGIPPRVETPYPEPGNYLSIVTAIAVGLILLALVVLSN